MLRRKMIIHQPKCILEPRTMMCRGFMSESHQNYFHSLSSQSDDWLTEYFSDRDPYWNLERWCVEVLCRSRTKIIFDMHWPVSEISESYHITLRIFQIEIHTETSNDDVSRFMKTTDWLWSVDACTYKPHPDGLLCAYIQLGFVLRGDWTVLAVSQVDLLCLSKISP